MAKLDISPMLAAMSEQPDAFSLSNGWLIYRPGRLRFKVQPDGSVMIDPERGDYAGLSVCAEQGRQLYKALESWREDYWGPREISRHFARYVRPVGLWRRWLHKLAEFRVHHRHEGALAIYAKAWAEIGQIAPRRDDDEPPPRRAKRNPPPPESPPANIRRQLEDVTRPTGRRDHADPLLVVLSVCPGLPGTH